MQKRVYIWNLSNFKDLEVGKCSSLICSVKCTQQITLHLLWKLFVILQYINNEFEMNWKWSKADVTEVGGEGVGEVRLRLRHVALRCQRSTVNLLVINSPPTKLLIHSLYIIHARLLCFLSVLCVKEQYSLHTS